MTLHHRFHNQSNVAVNYFVLGYYAALMEHGVPVIDRQAPVPTGVVLELRELARAYGYIPSVTVYNEEWSYVQLVRHLYSLN